MKRVSILLILITLCFARPLSIVEEIGVAGDYKKHRPPSGRGVVIAPLGDIRGILGPQGKSIAVCEHGDVVAVIYGNPAADPDDYMEVWIAYSVDSGATWTRYGPFSAELRRVYPGIDGAPDFCTNPGELFFVWQESPSGYDLGCAKVIIEEGTPSTPSPSTPKLLPHSADIYPWLSCIAVDPDNPLHIIATSWSYLNHGNYWAYCWISTNGGYAWTDTIPMCYIDSLGYPGHLRFGTGGYVLYTYGDLYDWQGTDIAYPHYIESTDGGYTWSAEEPLPEVPVLEPVNSQFWWHEMDCEVINNEPWIVHNDINQIFTNIADMWVFHGTGSPGSWTWDIIQVSDYDLDMTIADTTFHYSSKYPSVSYFPSVSYNSVLDVIFISFKANYYKAYPSMSPTEIYYDGAHIGGIASQNNGATWDVLAPVSDANTGQIPWDDWYGTEIAHRLVSIEGEGVYSYGVWVNDSELYAYFERGLLRYYLDENTAYGIDTGAPFSATIDIDPNVLNLKSHGRWITCYIEVPEEYAVEDIDMSTVALTAIDGMSIEPLYRDGPTEIGDYDEDDIPDLMVKFDRQVLIDVLNEIIVPPVDVELTVGGELTDGTLFAGSDTIRVISPGAGPKTDEQGSFPDDVTLFKIHPNPFKNTTDIRFQIPEVVGSRQYAVCSMKIFDITGRLVKQWDYTTIQQSSHISWDGTDSSNRKLLSGVYFLKFEVGDYSATEKLLLIK